MTLRELRMQKNLTQIECAKYLGISRRTYQIYEENSAKCPPIKYEYIIKKLSEYGFIDENQGILTTDTIQKICAEVFGDYNVAFCYLFGSYAKGSATGKSDIDLLISGDVDGLVFYELVENLREKLHKKIDLLSISQLNNNPELLNEILKDGIKIYG